LTASNIERVALDWMTARMVREHVHKLRGECLCEHESSVPDMVPSTTGTPCWKTTYKETSTRRDYETGEPVDMAWVPHRPLAEWCEPCKKRQELHERLLKARRREGALRASLTRICRARILAGEADRAVQEVG
jgi:hypothetical protein